MKILACDLDGTLIHSHKKFRDGDICVELYDGREQSFISPRALDLLKQIAAQIWFVPVTTRSIAQYRRIFWAEGFCPRYAVAANGAYLLDGDESENFLRDAVEPHVDELEALREKFSSAAEFDICRVVDGSFLYLRCRDDLDAEKISRDLQPLTSLAVRHTGRKIYIFPPQLNKGEALRGLVKKFSPTKIFAAGDSEIDLPMLELADVAFAPRTLRGEFVTCSESPAFAEEFLSRIKFSLRESI